MDLIDREALLNSGYPTIYHTEFGDEVINTEDIKNAPTVRPSLVLKDITEEDIRNFTVAFQRATSKGILLNTERTHGKWIKAGYSQFHWYCSNCGEHAFYDENIAWVKSNFCPNCGADMREDNNET